GHAVAGERVGRGDPERVALQVGQFSDDSRYDARSPSSPAGPPDAPARAAAILADAEPGGAARLPRAALLLRLARRQGPLQADRARRDVGDHPAARDDVLLRAGVRPLRRDVEAGERPVRAPRL